MTEEDEIDILGEFSLDNLFSKDENRMFNHSNLVSQNTDILNCDYTIHPQWLLDKPSTNPANWYNNSSDITNAFSNDTSDYSENNTGIESITDSLTDESGWTDKEKDLLKRGIEIFGKSNSRLAQFIGSKTAHEVKYFLKNFYFDIEFSCTNNDENVLVLDNEQIAVNEVVVDTELPATIEEVIASVTTAQPTITTNSKGKINSKPNDFSAREIQLSQQKKLKRIKEISESFCNIKNLKKNKKMVKFKFKTTLKRPPDTNKVKQQTSSPKNCSNQTASAIEIVTGNGLSVPVSNGEEVIKIQKETMENESDIEVDIEDTDTLSILDTVKPETVSVKNEVNEQDFKLESEEEKDVLTRIRKGPDLDSLPEDVKIQLQSTEIPLREVKLEASKITELEKVIHYEFFENRPTKTPSRYLKIRNHILNAWMIIKPSYVTKTSVRKGLQQCGDVNCIGRIHGYLEQIGAINFGCSQTSYIRPLVELIRINTYNKEKPTKEHNNQLLRLKMDLPRSRIKSKALNSGEGGCTITHNEQGDVVNTTVVNEEPVLQKVTRNVKKPIIKLTYCRPFTDKNPQKFSIHLHLSALILMDLHAHMSFSEVMGLVGGRWDNELKRLTISRYEPCKNIAPSSTHCDMCPISQANAANIFHNENLEVLGWYHSHPTFAPEPSQQDLDTQSSVQLWLGNNKPCIGAILSPFSLHGALIASPYRCMIVEKKENFEDQYVPYRFKVDIISSNIDVDMLLNRAWKIFNTDSNLKAENRINFSCGYFQDRSLTHLEKFITSIKMHLAKCSDINKMTGDAIMEGLNNICNTNCS